MYITDDSPNVKLIESSLCTFTLLSAYGLSVWHWEVVNWPHGGRVWMSNAALTVCHQFCLSTSIWHQTSVICDTDISLWGDQDSLHWLSCLFFFFFSFVTFSVEMRGGSKSNPAAAVTEASFGCEWSHRTSWRLSHCFSNNVHVVLHPSYLFCHHCNAYKRL